jgi:acyl-CoA thioesterase
MTATWNDLVGCLDLAALGDGSGFEGKNLPLEYHRLFGGQLLAQFLAAAGLTCPDKSVKSLHAVFAREGHADEPVRYAVDRHHEGGTSHTVWFHRPLRTDDWLLLRQQSPINAHGRSFGRGDVLTADGTLVASYAQEALVRFR